MTTEARTESTVADRAALAHVVDRPVAVLQKTKTAFSDRARIRTAPRVALDEDRAREKAPRTNTEKNTAAVLAAACLEQESEAAAEIDNRPSIKKPVLRIRDLESVPTLWLHRLPFSRFFLSLLEHPDAKITTGRRESSLSRAFHGFALLTC